MLSIYNSILVCQSVSVKPTTLSFATFMQFKKSIAATRSALRLGTNLSLPLQAVAPQSDAAHPQHRIGEGGATPCPYAPLAEQLPDKDKEQSEEGGVSVFSGRINFLHLKLVYLILPELCRRLGFPIRFSFYCAPPLLLLLASARATLLSFFAFLRFFLNKGFWVYATVVVPVFLSLWTYLIRFVTFLKRSNILQV